MTFIYLIGLMLFLLILWLGSGIRRIGAISQGAQVNRRTETALLMIDLQSVFWHADIYPTANKQTAQAAILDEVHCTKANGHPVIALRQEWSIPVTKVIARLTMKGQAVAGTEGTELAPTFADLPDHVLVKRVQDGFETGELDKLLADLNVGHLRIVGLDLNYCVLKTALAARNRGYEVTTVTQGTLAAGPRSLAQDKLIAAGVMLV